MSFKEIQNRDAWATIRGFVYQVQLTILQWLTLDDNQILELEKGEDIDLITQGINNQELERTLGQAKFRENGVSLGRNDIIEILLNYFVHIKENPNAKINFKYISNTDCVEERPAIFLNGKKGIDVWMELREREFNINDPIYIDLRNHLVKKIKLIIESYEEEGTKNDEIDVWCEFKSYVQKDDTLINLIKGFEWSLGKGDVHELEEAIKGKLSLITSYDVQSVYPRLFLHVFKVLCKSGIKRLIKTELLEQCKLPEIDQEENTLLKSLEAILGMVSNKLDSLENQVQINTETVKKLAGSDNSTSDLVFDYKLKSLTFDVPASVKNGSLRIKKVDELKLLFDDNNWISLQGINGSGKTQLAALVCAKFHHTFWLDLRPFIRDTDQLHLILEFFVSGISGVNFSNNRTLSLKKVGETLPSDSIIILNDVPNQGLNTQFDELLIGLS